jgi:hypothetical protein
MNTETLSNLEGTYGTDRDDYGRTCYRLVSPNNRTLGMIVKLPRISPVSPAKYLVNDWGRTGRDCLAVSDLRFATLKEAKLALEGFVAETLSAK